jgi:hypothetical protein
MAKTAKADASMDELPLPKPAPLPGLTLLEAIMEGAQLRASEELVPGIYLLSEGDRRICFGTLTENFRLAIEHADLTAYTITLSPPDYMDVRVMIPVEG